MKKIQILRLSVQVLFTGLATAAFFADSRAFMLIILCLTIFCGPFFCGWMCPYGFLQDVFGRIGKLLGVKKIKMPPLIQKILVFSRYAVFALVLISALDIVFEMISLDPRVNFMNFLGRDSVSLSAAGIILLFLAVSLLFERPFCNYLCYEGAKYGLIACLRVFSVKRDGSKCINCKKCDSACPMNIGVSKVQNISSPQCINCFECISACPVSGALSFGKKDMNKSEKKRYVVTACVALAIVGSLAGYRLFEKKDDMASQQLSNLARIEQNNPSATVGIANGKYTGEGEGFKGKTVVEVTVFEQRITAVEVVSTRDDYKWFERANSKIPDRIIDSQSTDVDTVSGSTYSSIGILDAVNDALQKAAN